MTYKFNPRDKDWDAYGKRLMRACELLGPPDEFTPNALGLDLYPVIPVELPVEEFHRVKPDGKGGFEPVRNSNGDLVAFNPKQPAYWEEWTDGTIKRRSIHWDDNKAAAYGKDPYNPGKTADHIANAKHLGRAIGLAVKTTQSVVVVDFDLKPFATPDEKERAKAAADADTRKDILAPAQARMEAAVDAWLEAHPQLKDTRAERTPSGGYHFWVKVKDQMASWSDGTDKGGKEVHHVNFALTQDGNHVGEILCGRICVCAPTSRNGSGSYELLNPANELNVAEVDNLAAVGIYPVAKGKRSRTETLPDGTVRKVMREPLPIPERPVSPDDYDAPLLLSLLGKKAQEVYNGNFAYRGGDRSANLSGFIHELNGWVAFLHDQGLPYEDGGLSVEDHIEVVADRLGLDDTARVERIIKSCDQRLATLSVPPDVALKRYALRQGGELPSTFTGLVQTERNPFDLCVTDLRSTLQDLVALNLGKADAAFRLKDIADEFEEPLHTVKDLFKQLNAEASEEDEASSALTDFIRTRSQGCDLEGILPDSLTAELLSIRTTALYEPPVILMTLISACSTAMPLSSDVNLVPEEGFDQALTVWFILLMESGELKSPLLRRIVTGPYGNAIKTTLNELRTNIEQWMFYATRPGEDYDIDDALDQLEETTNFSPETKRFISQNLEALHIYANTPEGKGEDAAEPSPDQVRRTIQQLLGPNPQLLLTGGGTKQGLDAQFEINSNWAGKGVLYLQDEMKALFLKIAKPSSTEVDFAEWLLSRYDGTGQREAKADGSRVRNYDACRITPLGGVQPSIYRDMLSDGDASGMTARFNAYEQPQVDQLFPTEFTALERDAAAQLPVTLENLYTWIFRIPQLHLTLSHEAFVRFQQYRAHAFQTKRAELTDAGKSLANKAHGKVGRLAAVLHVIHYAVGCNYQAGAIPTMSTIVGVDSMERAIKLHDLLYNQTLGVRLSSADNSPTAQLALSIHRKAKGKPDGVTLNALRAAFKSNNRPEMSELLALCTELQAQGVGRIEKVTHRNRTGYRYFHLKDL